ncbi:MAG: hypothetical protein RLW42_05215, partial [Gammaproteobacteria bacterium]
MSTPPEQRNDALGDCGRELLRGVLFAALFAASVVVAARETVVAVLADGPLARPDATLEAVIEEVETLLGREHTVRFPAALHRDGGWSVDGIAAALEDLLTAPDVDVVVTSGLIATHLAAHRAALPKPVIGMVVADPVLQSFPLDGAASGKDNFTYVAGEHTVGDDLAAFHRLVGYRHLAIAADRVLIESLPELPGLVADAQARLGVHISAIVADTGAAEFLARLPAGVDAVYVSPLPRFDDAQLAALADGLAERGLPSYTLLGHEYLERGFLMSGAGRGVDHTRTARRVALDLQAIVLGEPAAALPVALAQPRKLAINLRTAEAIGYAPRWEELEGAVVVDRPAPAADTALSLVGALERALEASLQLRVSELEPLIANADQAERRAQLLPQIGLASSARVIDADRANP